MSLAVTAAMVLGGSAAIGWALRRVTPLADPEAQLAAIRAELGPLDDQRELQRGLFEVSAELVGCVAEDDARERFAAALRRYWLGSSFELLVRDGERWRSLGGQDRATVPPCPASVQLPHAGDDRLVLDLSTEGAAQAMAILHGARRQPSLAAFDGEGERAVAETLRAQLALSLRRVRLYGELQALARLDPLTGCHRRWYGEQRLRELVDGGSVVAVAMVDIDHFKRFNDSWGHQAGDGVLAAVGRCLGNCLRSNDLVCRWGGEEFLAILPETPPGPAAQVSERLRQAIAAITGLPDAVTVSIGIASCAQDDTHYDLVARADQALYDAKMTGRNRVVTAQPEEAGTRLLRLSSRGGSPGAERTTGDESAVQQQAQPFDDD